MVDLRYPAAPNRPNEFILFHRKMKGLLWMGVAASALIVGCTPKRTPPTLPTPEKANPPLVLPPFQMDTGRTIDRVPPFQQTPLIVWGPLPEGVTHAERVRTYDLQHQATTVRFDWLRRAVVGTTTLTIAGLKGASPLSSLAIDAGDMTFTRVAAGATSLKYDYDGRALTVHLATPLRSGRTTSITIDYEGANRLLDLSGFHRGGLARIRQDSAGRRRLLTKNRLPLRLE